MTQPTSPSVDALIACREFLESMNKPVTVGLFVGSVSSQSPTYALIAKIDAALSAPRVEPVAWRYRIKGTAIWKLSMDRLHKEPTDDLFELEPLYAAPPSQPDTREALERIKNYPHNGDATAQGMAAIAREALTDCDHRPGGKSKDWLDGQDRGLRQGLHIAETIVVELLASSVSSTMRGSPVDHSNDECPNFPGCHCIDQCIDGWKHPSPELASPNRGGTE